MNGSVAGIDSLREANRARKQVLLAELDRIQAQKEAVEQQLAALGRAPTKSSQAKSGQLLAGGPKKRPAKGLPLDDGRPDKRPKGQPEWQKKEQAVWSTCQTVLKSLTKGGLVHVFMQPVNLQQFPDYSKFVKKPMDLGTVGKKLNKRDYTDPAQFRDDVRQVWKNCSLYNTPDSPVGKTGIQMSDKFESQWSKYMVEDKWRQAQLSKQQAAQEQRNGVSAEEFHSLGRQLHDVTERIEIRTNPGPPGPDRDMTFDEKRKLSVYIGSLDGDKLERVFEIITQEEPDLPGGQDGEIELDMDALSSKALWALYELYASSGAGKTGPPRKGVGAGRSGTPGPARGASQPPTIANQAEVSSQRSPAVKREGSGATAGPGAAADRPAIADSSTSSDSSSDDNDDAQAPQKGAGPGGPTLMSSNHLGAPQILPSGQAKPRQDTKLSNAAAWGNLGADEEDGQKANDDDDEDNADGLWNNFQSRDDVERVEKQRQVKEKEEAIRRQKEEEAQKAAAAAAKAREEDERQKTEAAARIAEEQAASQRQMEQKQAQDRAELEAQAQEQDLEGAKNVHKLLHRAKAPTDGGLALRGDESDDDFGDDDEEEEQGADKMDVGDEEGEVEEI